MRAEERARTVWLVALIGAVAVLAITLGISLFLWMHFIRWACQ